MATKKVKRTMSKDQLRFNAEQVLKWHAKVEHAESVLTFLAIHAGWHLRLIRNAKGNNTKYRWLQIVEKLFSGITQKDILKYMKLAERIKPSDSKPICVLGRERIFKLLTMAKQKTRHDLKHFLAINRIGLPKDHIDMEEVERFRAKVDRLIEES